MISLLLWFLAFYTQEAGWFVAALCWMLFAWERSGRRMVFAMLYATEQHIKRNNCPKADFDSEQVNADVSRFLSATKRD